MSNDDPHLPPPLADALRGAFAHKPNVPARLDESILSRALTKFAQRRRMRMLVRWGSGAAAAIAACIVLAIFILPGPQQSQLAQKKLDPTRQVDMVDAMLLARQIQGGRAIDRSWDFNRDGKIDQADVEAIAHAAVSLEARTIQTERRGLPGLDELGVKISQARPARPRQGAPSIAFSELRKERPQ